MTPQDNHCNAASAHRNDLLESPIFRKNWNALHRTNPALADLILSTPIPGDCEIKAGAEPPIMKVGGTLVHSTRNPHREAQRLVDASIENNRTRAVLFFGLGLGFAVEYALQCGEQYHCVVYEPEIGLLTAAFLVRDCSHILENEYFSLFAGTEAAELLPLLRSLRREELVLVRNRALYMRNSSVFQELERTIENLSRRQEINHNTLVRFGKRWVRNLAKNLSVVTRAAPVERLSGAYTGLPALLLAGGPSLDDILPLLPQLAERTVIIAVDTSLSATLRAGVTPDYAVIVDPQYWNTRHLDAAREAKCEIISESSTHPRVFRLLNGPVSMCSSLFPLGKHIEDPSEPFGALGAGGSVSTTAWDFARHLGCSPIYCAGLDLGFPRHNTHFRGSYFEARALTLCDRYFPVETMAFDYLHSGHTERISANNGGTVLSDRRMNIYIWWFETQARMYPDTLTRNLSRDGVAIPGVPYAPVEELLDMQPKREQIKSIRDSFSPSVQTQEQRNRRRMILHRRLNRLLEELSALQQCAERAQHTAHSAREQYEQTGRVDPWLLETLDQYDKEILNNEYRDVAAFLLQETTERVRTTRNHRDSLALSEEIYRELSESCRYHHTILDLHTLE